MGIIIDPQLPQERSREETPEEVDDEYEGGGQVEGEAVVLVSGHFGAGAGHGFRRAEAAG